MLWLQCKIGFFSPSVTTLRPLGLMCAGGREAVLLWSAGEHLGRRDHCTGKVLQVRSWDHPGHGSVMVCHGLESLATESLGHFRGWPSNVPLSIPSCSQSYWLRSRVFLESLVHKGRVDEQLLAISVDETVRRTNLELGINRLQRDFEICRLNEAISAQAEEEDSEEGAGDERE
ncbi:UNVERIFIED_CONTAM: hypothetical protein K2H54_027086 [Gekko kuhli]